MSDGKKSGGEKEDMGKFQLSAIVEKYMRLCSGQEYIPRLNPTARLQQRAPSSSSSAAAAAAPPPPSPSAMVVSDLPPKRPMIAPIPTMDSAGETKPARNKFTRRFEIYRMISVVSPFEFYMHLTSDTDLFQERGRVLRMLKEESASWKEDEKVAFVPAKFKVYGFFDKGVWKRVRLLDWNEDCGQALVYFLDEVVRTELVSLDSLRPLKGEIANSGILPIYRCHLYDVIPPDESHIWSEDVCAWFQLTVNRNSRKRLWAALQLSFQKTRIYDGPDYIRDIGVVLFEDSSKCIQSLNWRMVDAGLAKAKGIGGNPPQMPYVGGAIPYFPSDDYVIDPNNFDGTIPKHAALRMSQVAIIYAKGPNCIYLQSIDKMAELLALEKEIGQVIYETGAKPFKIWEVSELQLVSYLREDSGKNIRSVVIRALEREVEIFAVDYGYRFLVPARSLYPMPSEFSDIPAYIHRVHLKVICPPKSESNYSEENCNEFRRRLEDLKLVSAFFPFHPDPALQESIVLQHFNQGIRFNHGDGKWVAEKLEKRPSIEEYEGIVCSPQLLPHLVSYPVEIVVVPKTKKSGDGERWRLHYLRNHFLKNKEKFGMHLVEGMEEFDRGKYYAKLRCWNDRFWNKIIPDDKEGESEED